MFANGAEIGVLSFAAASHPPGACGSNGLPLTPHSISIAGRTEALLGMKHPHLCKYIAAERSRNERVFLVIEHYPKCALDLLGQKQSPLLYCDEKAIQAVVKLLFQLLSTLEMLHHEGIVVRNLCCENLLLAENGDAKLYNFGFANILDNGNSVDFPIGQPRYFSPERIALGPLALANPKEDIWACGIIALECLCGTRLGPSAEDGDKKALLKYFQHVLQYCEERRRDNDLNVYSSSEEQCGKDLNYVRRFSEHAAPGIDLHALSADMVSFLAMCLHPHVQHRPCAADLLSHPIFRPFNEGNQKLMLEPLRCLNLPPLVDVGGCVEALLAATHTDSSSSSASLQDGSSTGNGSLSTGEHPAILQYGAPPASTPSPVATSPTADAIRSAAGVQQTPLAAFSVEHVYRLWTLAGGDVEADLERRGLARSAPPICTLPGLVRQSAPAARARTAHAPTSAVLDMSALSRRLASASINFTPALLPAGPGLLPPQALENQNLSLAIRERDLDHQAQRVVVVQRLLAGLPHTREYVLRESRIDIPPLCRPSVWAVLLGVGPNAAATYREIDKDVNTATDHQLDLDIPRCHQYDTILSSPTGHARLRQVLKAWVVCNDGSLTYWQGLDSLCAVFVRLHFTELGTAYACFEAFTRRYLHNFFLKDNSEVVREYLVIFSQLVAFQDPVLHNHITAIGFIPELYAISWFLTCFAHVFPLDKVYHLWDRVLLGDSRMPLCVGVAILTLLRAEILEADFNSCILRFSDVPDVDMEACGRRALEIYDSTPPSLLSRHHSTPPDETAPSKLEFARRKQFVAPSLCWADFKALRETNSALVIDTRATELAAAQTGPLWVSVGEDGESLDKAVADGLLRRRGATVVVLAAHRPSTAARVAERLVQAGVARVVVLEGGLNTLKEHGLVRQSNA